MKLKCGDRDMKEGLAARSWVRTQSLTFSSMTRAGMIVERRLYVVLAVVAGVLDEEPQG